MLRMIWLWLQDLFGLGRNDGDNESGSDSGHGIDPDG